MQYTFTFMHYPNIGTKRCIYRPSQHPVIRLQQFAAVTLPDRPNANHQLLDPNWRLYCNTKHMEITDHADESYLLEPDRLYLIPPWQESYRKELVHSQHIFIHFSTPWLLRPFILQAWTQPVVPTGNEGGVTHIRQIAERMIINQGKLTARDHMLALQLLNTCITEAIENLPQTLRARLDANSQLNQQLREVMHYVELNLDDDLFSEVLAEIACVSPTHLRRLFKKTFNISPNAFVIEQRIARAAEMLINSQDSIETIAELTGFSQRFYFTRTFSKLMGQPPAQYRKLNQLFH